MVRILRCNEIISFTPNVYDFVTALMMTVRNFGERELRSFRLNLKFHKSGEKLVVNMRVGQPYDAIIAHYLSANLQSVNVNGSDAYILKEAIMGLKIKSDENFNNVKDFLEKERRKEIQDRYSAENMEGNEDGEE